MAEEITIYNPLPYQMEGAEWLCTRKRALLADEMGLGKSCQAIRAADMLYAARILVVCPAVARANWVEEWKKWSFMPRTYFPIFKEKDAFGGVDSYVVVVSYDLVERMRARLTSVKWDVVILDESHYLKNRMAKRTKVIYGGKRANGPDIARNAEHLWCLSGTPAPNNAAELWTMLHAFEAYPDNYHAFLNEYCTYYQSNFGITITGNKRANHLRDTLRSVMLRRKKVDVMRELPPISYHELLVEPAELSAQDELVFFPDHGNPTIVNSALHEDLVKQRGALNVVIGALQLGEPGLQALGATAPAMGTLRRYLGLQKVQPVCDILKRELDDKAMDKVVIFAYHRQVIQWLAHLLKDYGVVTLYGGTPGDQRARRINKFNISRDCRVFIGQINACNTSISLTAAHQVVMVECDWVPAVNAQAVMRCHRIGQKMPVTVRFVALADNLDRKIQQVLKHKTERLAEIFE